MDPTSRSNIARVNEDLADIQSIMKKNIQVGWSWSLLCLLSFNLPPPFVHPRTHANAHIAQHKHVGGVEPRRTVGSCVANLS